jgi:hypothetical protein
MSLEIIKFGFVAGEIAPAFYGRPDLEKFDFGLAKAYNWFVDYRGGLSSRPGSKFNEFLKNDTQPIMMFEFRFNTDLANTYNMIFGHQYIRFVQDGSYITEAPKTPTAITNAAFGIVTSNAHGYSNGEWIKIDGVGGMTELNGRTVIVGAVTPNTFQLHDHNGTGIDTTNYGTFTGGGNLRRVYEVSSPYQGDDVDKLCVTQYRDRVTITHKDYAPRKLVRVADTNWTLSLVETGSSIVAPITLTHISSTDDNGCCVYAVTAVSSENEESLQSEIHFVEDGPDFTGGSNQLTLRWEPVAGAKYYNVYRSLYTRVAGAAAQPFTRGADLGYAGRVFGTSFTDNNIIPDFTKTPPTGNNPFAPSTIEQVDVIPNGTGFTNADVFSVTDAGGGTGFFGLLLVDAQTGELGGVKIINGGEGYVTPVANVTGVGTGATFTFTMSPATGMWPGQNAIHQQRQVYAASDNDPLTLWGSKPSYFDNFDVSSVVAENDSYEFELDSGDLTPIKHLMVVRGGLLCLTETGIWVVNGGNESAAITPTNVLADPHTFVGCADVRPIRIDTDLIYVEHKGFTVRQLEYNDFSKLYSGNDISILSHHLFNQDQQIQSWTYASDPYKVIWAAKADGKFLSLTIVKDQKVYAWCEHGTRGFVERFITLEEDGHDVVYFIVKRQVDGGWHKYLESFSTDQIEFVEDAVVMDSALTLGATYPAAGLGASTVSGATTFLATANVFAPGDVGKIIRSAGGKAVITAYVAANEVDATWIRAPNKFIPETDDAGLVPSVNGEWTMDAPVSSVSGLWHLEGQTVQILADGNQQDDQVVVNGRITLENTPTRVCAGLKFESIAQSLPLTITGEVIEGMRKRVPQIAVRQLNSRGMKIGRDLDHLYYMKERKYEPMGEPTNLQSGMRLLSIQPAWEDGGQLYFFRDQPTPVSLLGYVTSTELGDDPG